MWRASAPNARWGKWTKWTKWPEWTEWTTGCPYQGGGFSPSDEDRLVGWRPFSNACKRS